MKKEIENLLNSYETDFESRLCLYEYGVKKHKEKSMLYDFCRRIGLGGIDMTLHEGKQEQVLQAVKDGVPIEKEEWEGAFGTTVSERRLCGICFGVGAAVAGIGAILFLSLKGE